MGKRIAWDFGKLRADIEAGRTFTSIAAELDCNEKAVARVAQERGIKRSRNRLPMLNDTEWLHTAYIDERRSMSSMAREAECSRSTLAKGLEDNGIELWSDRPNSMTVHG